MGWARGDGSTEGVGSGPNLLLPGFATVDGIAPSATAPLGAVARSGCCHAGSPTAADSVALLGATAVLPRHCEMMKAVRAIASTAATAATAMGHQRKASAVDDGDELGDGGVGGGLLVVERDAEGSEGERGELNGDR